MSNTFKVWMNENFEYEQMKDIAQYGANNGWSGLCYTNEILDLYQQHQEAIWEILAEGASEFGETVLGFIAQFNGAKGVDNQESLYLLLVAYAAEKVAYDTTQDEF